MILPIHSQKHFVDILNFDQMFVIRMRDIEETPTKMSEIKNIFPKHRQDVFAVKSWGYKNCFFYFDDHEKILRFQGEQYVEKYFLWF